MKKFLILLLPLVLLAQVVQDTVIRLPTSNLGRSFFIPELNKLYVAGREQFFVLDCSTYEVKAQIPTPRRMLHANFAWNWRRQKLYVTNNPYPDSTMVIDAAADSVIGWSAVSDEDHWNAYVSDIDRRYKSVGDTLYGFECAADTVVQRILPPVPGYGISYTCWDSVGRKLYLPLAKFQEPSMAVYDYVADSFTKVIDVSSIPAWALDALVFSHACRKAYIGPYQPEMGAVNVGIIDTERDTLVGVLPVRIWSGLYTQVAVNDRDGKVYLADNDTYSGTPDTLWVVDCYTDSVLRKVEYEHGGSTYGANVVRWVPWSNRIYLGCYDFDSSKIVVLDCSADSIVEPGLHLGNQGAVDIQLDPIRERVFIIRADSNTIHVLRDTGYAGVAESRPAGPRPVAGLRLQMTSGGYEVGYSIASPSRVDLRVYDLMGREVRRLVGADQPAGQHRVVWDSRNHGGAVVAHGVYFVRLDTPSFSDVKKAVVTR
jgi:hypothetical protein